MEYSLSFDASLKIKKGQEKGFINHIARDVYEQENGKALQHKNDLIDREWTKNNLTFVNDGNGNLKNMESISEATDYLDSRLATVKKTLRKDAVIARPLIIQLDSEYIENHSMDDITELLGTSMEWIAGEFGMENIVCGSIHADESNPHLHVFFTPVTEDGRLSQKEWFKNPSSLRDQHNRFRKHMQDNGYQATNERVSGARKGLDLDEYKAMMDMKQSIKEKEKEVKQQGISNTKQSMSLASTRGSLKRKEKALEAREKEIDRKALEINKKASALKLESDKLQKRANQIQNLEAKVLRDADEEIEKRKQRARNDIELATQQAMKKIRTSAIKTGEMLRKAEELEDSLRTQHDRYFDF